MTEFKPLNTGVAYHGSRILSHVSEDMREITAAGMNTVVHMYTHNDMERHRAVFRDIVAMSEQLGLDVWVDNWGIEGGPGDKAHFLAYHPNARMYFSNGSPSPIKACYNSEEFLAFTYEWLDQVRESGAKTVFWDEPYIPADDDAFACACPVCRKMFEELYGKPMPKALTPEVVEFRTRTIQSYFTKITGYAASLGIKSVVCVMFEPRQGVSLDNLDHIGSIDTLSNIGCDPYWFGSASGCGAYDFVYSRTKKNVDFCDSHGKDHNIWIQTFGAPAGREDEIVLACDAAYDAGARTILGWSFRGAESNDYRCERPEKAWAAFKFGIDRVRSRWFDDLRASLKNN